MADPTTVVVSAATEGIVDEAVVRRMILEVGAQPGPVYGKNGKRHLRERITGYNNAARFSPWIVLLDLDHDAGCAPPLRSHWLPKPAPFMCLRIAVRQVEAWLLADRENIAKFLAVAASRVPRHVETMTNAKEAMVDLARRSRRRDIREDMMPRSGSGRSVGPTYASRLIEFAQGMWNPQEAARPSDSLRRSMKRLEASIAAYRHSAG
jgi:hypothetical protein